MYAVPVHQQNQIIPHNAFIRKQLNTQIFLYHVTLPLLGWHTAGINVLGSFVLGGVFGSPLIDPTTAASASASASSAAPTTLTTTNANHAKLASSTMPTPKKAASTSSMMGLGLGLTPRMKLMLGVGFCGSFTTASTMNLDVANMIGRGEMMKAASYVMMNNVGGVCAAAAGMMLAKKLFLFRRL